MLGRKLSSIYRVVLTTREGDDNTWSTMCKHLKAVVQQIRCKGVGFEYIFMPHVSEQRSLLHLDGLVYIWSNSISAFELEVLWSGVHGATEVTFGSVRSWAAVKRYTVSHMFKDYDLIANFAGRIPMSKRWLPGGYVWVDRMLTQWALERLPSWGVDVWLAKHSFIESWLRGEKIAISFGRKLITLQREKEDFNRI